MPTLTRNWQEQARTLIAAGMSVRRAARELGLPEERVKKWATRAKVCQTVTTVTMSPMSPFVPMAADILAKQGPDTRAKLSIAGNKAATALADLPGETLIGKDTSTALLQVTKANAVIHSWQEKAQSAPLVSLAFYGSPQAHEQVRPIEAIEQSSD